MNTKERSWRASVSTTRYQACECPSAWLCAIRQVRDPRRNVKCLSVSAPECSIVRVSQRPDARRVNVRAFECTQSVKTRVRRPLACPSIFKLQCPGASVSKFHSVSMSQRGKVPVLQCPGASASQLPIAVSQYLNVTISRYASRSSGVQLARAVSVHIPDRPKVPGHPSFQSQLLGGSVSQRPSLQVCQAPTLQLFSAASS